MDFIGLYAEREQKKKTIWKEVWLKNIQNILKSKRSPASSPLPSSSNVIYFKDNYCKKDLIIQANIKIQET